jgi:hypothetical protein
MRAVWSNQQPYEARSPSAGALRFWSIAVHEPHGRRRSSIVSVRVDPGSPRYPVWVSVSVSRPVSHEPVTATGCDKSRRT